MNSRWFAPLIFASAVLGWLTAVTLPDIVWLDQFTQLLRTAFFSALKMVIAPLIFFSLIAGVMQLRASRQMGRLGSVTIAYYLTTTGIAVCIGLVVVLFYHPWTAFPPLIEDASALGDVTAQSARLINPGDGSTFSLLNNLLQRMLINPFNALSEMNVLGILVGAIFIGLAAAMTVPEDSAIPKIFDELAQVTYKLAG
ncbi:MAG: cation:dicarboxylase symporter family transporter, partial [Pseudomonadales bacterium]|nr:cation:dicarboxylase symporter family transporter [Pseudomonadales bacterium]